MTEAEGVVMKMGASGISIALAEAQAYLDASYGRLPMPTAHAVLDYIQRKLKSPLRLLLEGHDPLCEKAGPVCWLAAERGLTDAYGQPESESLNEFLHRTGLSPIQVLLMPDAELLRYGMPEDVARRRGEEMRDTDDILWKLEPVCRRVGFADLIEDEREFCQRTGLTHEQIVAMSPEQLAAFA
jgi:hypothetical protein